MREKISGILISIALVAVMTAFIVLSSQIAPLSHGTILYLVPVLISAIRWGAIPAVITAIAGVAASAFFIYPPLYSLRITDPQHILDLVLFVIVAIVTSQLAGNLNRQAEIARRGEIDMRALYAFSRRLAVSHDAAEIYAAIQEHFSSVIQRKVVLVGADIGSQEKNNTTDDNVVPKLVRREAAKIAASDDHAVRGMVVETDTGSYWLLRVISPRTRELGIIAIDLGNRSRDEVDAIIQHVDAVLVDAMATLERLDIGQAITEARMRSETNLLREALLGSVSHELRTPLASILGAATVLFQAPAITKDTRLASLAHVVRDEAERLNNDIQNLLDATRISSKGVITHLEWADPGDIVNTAIERRRQRLSGNRILLDVSRDLPFVKVDQILIEQALGQILDNAAKYSPSGTAINVMARSQDERVVISVTDRGAGLTKEEQERLWERFYRGERHLMTVTGSGLGLWIAHAFVVANGGNLKAVSEGAGCGTTVTISLPAHIDVIPNLADGSDE